MPGHSSKKQSQRTKGNVRPSSSSHAAQLLTASGGSHSGLIGFGTLTGSPAYVPASQCLDDADSSLDSDFRMVLRKLAKKDSTTKIKALQEFAGLCKDKDEEILKGVLPYWPRIYNKMALDLDPRVRETAQHSMNALVLRVRRSLAPYLKNLMGCWLLGQCDTYPTVATAALQSFQTAFPPAKQTDALVFCKQESFEYLVDNILNQTPTTLSDPNATELRDRENKYNRVLSSSLLALRKLITAIPANQQSSIVDQVKLLLNSPKFWKLGKSDIQTIKGSMFSFLSGICQAQSELASEYSSKLSPLVLHSLDESDPSLCYYVWECILSVVKNIENCWAHVNIQKAFWPKLKTVLENGCHGNAVVIGPNLLPLLSQIPVDKMPRPDTFFEDFFACMKTGLGKDQVQSSSSECNALVTSFTECVQFAVKKSSSQSSHIVNALIMDQVLPVVQASLSGSSASFYRSPLYGQMAQLIFSLENTDSATLDQVSLQYWKNLAIFVREKLETEQPSLAFNTLTERVVYLVRSIIYPETNFKAKSEKVTFEDQTKQLAIDSEILEKRKELSEGAELFLKEVLLSSFLQAYNHWSVDHLKLFSQILELEVTDSTLKDIVECCHGEEIGNQSAADQFVFVVCLPWLSKLQGNTENQVGIKYLINIICTFISSFEKSSSLILLEKLCKALTDLEAFHILLEKILTKHKTLAAVKEWLKSESLGQKLVATTAEVCQLSLQNSQVEEDIIQHGWNIISLVLSAADDIDPIVNKDHIQQILSTIHHCLLSLASSPSTDRVNMAVKFVSQAAHNFFSTLKGCLLLSSAGDLLVVLFTICLDSTYGITEETLELCRSACLCGVGGVVQYTGALLQDDGVLCRVLNLIKQQVTETDNIKSFDGVFLMTRRLIETVQESLKIDDTSDQTLQSILEELYVSTDLFISDKICVYLTMTGQFTYLGIYEDKVEAEENWMKMIVSSLFNSRLLDLGVPAQDAQNQTHNKADNTWWTDNRQQILLDAAAAMSLCKIQIKMEKSDRRATDVVAGTDQLSAIVSTLVLRMSKPEKSSLLKTAVSRCESDGFVWAVCLQDVILEVLKTGDLTLDVMPILDRCHDLTVNRVHLLQCVMPYSTPQDCSTVSEVMVARILSSGGDSKSIVDGSFGPLSILNKCLPSLLKTMDTEAGELIRGTLSQILSWREENDTLFLFGSDLRESSAELILLNMLVCELLELIVRDLPHMLTDKEWDFLLCSLVSWIQSIEESTSARFGNGLVKIFANNVCRLLREISVFMRDKLPSNPSAFPQDLQTEWQDFFSEGAFGILIALFVKQVAELKDGPTSSSEGVLLQNMGSAISFCTKQSILENKLPPYFIPGELSLFPEALQTVLNHLCPMLTHANRSMQTTAFWLLKSIMPELNQYEKEFDNTDEQSSRSPPVCLVKILDQSTAAMDIVLSDIPVEECMSVQPYSDEYQYALAYLCAWKLFLVFFQSSPAELRQEYAAYVRENGAISKLMSHLFALMPNSPTTFSVSEMENKAAVSDEPSEMEIQNLACSVYHSTLQIMPAMARQWWIEQDRKTAAYVDKFTSKHMSPALCAAELQTVQGSDVQLVNMTVRARPTTREVVATYALEEVSIEIVITMPTNYPLGCIAVLSEKRVGVSAGQWDKWLLQLGIFLQHQNGSVMEGLKLWKKNIDKRFEGVDDCMICFSVLHGTNFQLPRLTCKTCKKKFHSACLYKWFSTSHNSTCPMCRNLF